MHDPQPCACTTLHLSAPTLRDLRQRYHGCLCLQCLGELARDTVESAPGRAREDQEP